MSTECPVLTDPSVLIDPYSALGWLREHAPVHWAPEVQAWVVTRHADVTAGFRDQRLSADRVKVLAHVTLRGGDTLPVREYLRVNNDMMLMKDGADHHR